MKQIMMLKINCVQQGNMNLKVIVFSNTTDWEKTEILLENIN